MGITNAGVIEELIRRALLCELEPSLTDDDRVSRLTEVSSGDGEAITRAISRIREINRVRSSFLAEQAIRHLELARERVTGSDHAVSA